MTRNTTKETEETEIILLGPEEDASELVFQGEAGHGYAETGEESKHRV